MAKNIYRMFPRRTFKQWLNDTICKFTTHKWVEGTDREFGRRTCSRCGKYEMLYINKYPTFEWK